MNASQKTELLRQLKDQDLQVFPVAPADAASKREVLAKLRQLLDRSKAPVITVLVSE